MLRKNVMMLGALTALAGCALETGDKPAGDPTDADFSSESLGAADAARGPGTLSWCERAEGTLTRARPTAQWNFTGQCDDAFIDLASRDGDDMFVILYSRPAGTARWSLLDFNDDCGSGTLNACLELATDADTEYQIVATTYQYIAGRRGTSATYHLTVSCRDDAGECVQPGTTQSCGSRGLGPCPDGMFCAWEESAMCGAADHPGVCATRPDACIALYDPVCGCDGATYGNACYAASAGVSVAASGECETTGEPEGALCGGLEALECAAGFACDYSADEACYRHRVGTCVVDEPRACTREYAPVCGCDGVTYSNDCNRRAAYVALSHAGPC